VSCGVRVTQPHTTSNTTRLNVLSQRA